MTRTANGIDRGVRRGNSRGYELCQQVRAQPNAGIDGGGCLADFDQEYHRIFSQEFPVLADPNDGTYGGTATSLYASGVDP